MLRTRAPAKINLTLHVLCRRLDGYHDLESLVAFAGVADLLELRTGEALSLDVDGPTAGASGVLEDNLVLRASRALVDLAPGLRVGRFRLTKRLPVGAGVGGGSADAAAALRLLARANGLRPEDDRLHEAARRTGADVPVCLLPRAKVMRGVGDQLGQQIRLGALYALLVNPRVHLDTGRVFAGMGLRPGDDRGDGRARADVRLGGAALLEALAGASNDMQPAAIALAPIIGDVLAVLDGARGCALARMSGSGSTCFGLFRTRLEARHAAATISRSHPHWWVRATALA